MYLVVDCNNFFVSCERLFNPSLQDKPVVVLSSNDGCVVARSNDIKPLVPMGAPYFKYKKVLAEKKTHVFSSNFYLYGNISTRVHKVLYQFDPGVEIYSIDEAFMDVSTVRDPEIFGEEIRKTVQKWVGIPVSVGIAPTKTLSKVANEIAKKNTEHNGVVYFEDMQNAHPYFENVAVNDVWGIGRGYTARLEKAGITTVAQLLRAPDDWIKRVMGVGGLATVWELRGIHCKSLQSVQTTHKSIVRSKSFGTSIQSRQKLGEAVAHFASRVARKLRKTDQRTGHMVVFAHVKGGGIKARSARFSHSDDSFTLCSTAQRLARSLHKAGTVYKKAGVLCTDITTAAAMRQSSFFAVDNRKIQQASAAMDAINDRYGSRSVFLGAEGLNLDWSSKTNHISKSHYNDIYAIPTVIA